ncbi:MAG: V-type ATP synthase subunit D [bacterium]|nr:V-type ATP synthase subunit D [bacterium]
MKLDVNSTRMELLRLRKRTILAKRGHRLLKDKQDELMRKLLDLLKVLKELRERVERELELAIKRFLFARSSMEPEWVEEALLLPSKSVSIELERKRLLNVEVPVFKQVISGKIHCYGFATTACEFDLSLLAIDKALQVIIELAEREKTLELIAIEIGKTRRRVNALEYVLIPSLEETVKYIQMKLLEMERGNLSRLMRIKEIVRAH